MCHTLGLRGDTLWKALEDAKTDTKSAIKLYKNNQMQANATKFHYMYTSKDTDTDFQCECINIKPEDMVKMSGIKKLKFTSHVTEGIRKCAYLLNALKRKSKILNTKTKMLIYYAFIEANLNYCPLIWMNRNKTDMKNIENVQKRALRMVFNDYSSSYHEFLKRAKTCTLEIRWKRQLVTDV